MNDNCVRAGFVAGAAVSALALAVPALAMPRLMDLYNEHPRARPQNRDKCVVCHVNADGSGEMTTFGERYEHEGLQFTEKLMAEYGNLFAPAGSSGKTDSDSAPKAAPAATAPDPAWTAARFYKEECTKCHGKYADGDPLQGVPAFATRKWIEERLPKPDELFAIIMKGKDKMVGMEGKLSDEQGRLLLEYVKSIALQYGSS